VKALHKNALWLVGFMLACALAVVVRLDHVHQESGEWRMRPAADPLTLRYHGHVYDRVGVAGGSDPDFVKHRDDLGGGIIFAPRGVGAPASIEVDDGATFYDYRLAG
jgi:predicted outer membrane lipoprotein